MKIKTIQDAIDFKAPINYGNKKDDEYEVSFYCYEDKIIHSNLKSVLKCKKCFSEQDRLIHEAKKRMEWFLDNYFKYNLGDLFSKIPTEKLCELYNINIKYFKPWL